MGSTMKLPKHKASIIAVGTEITTGEVINTNAAWLSERLDSIGVKVVQHLAVADDRESIQTALDYAQTLGDFIFVTGGLGPTSDDFTREVISKWTGKPLVFDDTAWSFLIDLLMQRGLSVRENHKQECFFPKHAILLKNVIGTANGFLTEKGTTQVFVLPGPPREIQAMWEPEVVPRLNNYSIQKTEELHIWNCLGAPESEVAETVERVLEGSGLAVGYRANIPYVKVKIWTQKGSSDEVWLHKVDEALSQWLVGKGKTDPIENWLRSLVGFGSVLIFDSVTHGRLASRIETFRDSGAALITPFPPIELISHLSGDRAFRDVSDEKADCILKIEAVSDQEFEVQLLANKIDKSERKTLPHRLSLKVKRGRLYATEEAIHFWTEGLKPLTAED